jgi:tRNA(fMet)-specific endonuclease VapC
MTHRYLIDTNTLSEPTKDSPHPKVISNLFTHKTVICTASPVIHEFRYGIFKLDEGTDKRKKLEEYFNDDVLALDIYDYTLEAAIWHGKERARLEKEGKTAPIIDTMIAAIAVAYDLILVTNDQRFTLYGDRKFTDLQFITWHTS